MYFVQLKKTIANIVSNILYISIFLIDDHNTFVKYTNTPLCIYLFIMIESIVRKIQLNHISYTYSMSLSSIPITHGIGV